MLGFYEMCKLLETSDNWWAGMSDLARRKASADAFYGQLTTRDDMNVINRQYQQMGLANKEQEYEQMVNTLAAQLKSKGYSIVGQGGSFWVHVQMPAVQYGANYSGSAPVEAFKTYRSFVAGPQNRITNYLKALESFADVLRQIQDADRNYADRMQFKFPGSLNVLFGHPDSLVVHWRNKYNRNRVEKAIDDHFTRSGVQFSNRGARASAGYDFGNSGNFGGGSHSELVSQAIYKLLARYPQYAQLDDQQLRNWLQQWMAYFSKMNPSQMWAYLQS